MSQINVAFGLPAYPTSSTTTTSTTTTTTPSPIAGSWRDFLNGRQQPVRNFNGNLGRSLTPFGTRFAGSQPRTFGNNGVGRNVISTAAARNIMQNVLGRNGGQQSLSGIPANVPTGDLNSIIANTAQRFTQPNRNINSNQQDTNQFPTQFRTDVNQQGSNNQFPTSQIRNDLLRQRITNFQIQDPNIATSDRAEAISNFMNQQNQPDSVNTGVNFPLLNRVLQQGVNPQFARGESPGSAFQMVSEPSSQIGTHLQNFEGNVAAVDIGQLPRAEQMFLPATQQRRNFVTITSTIPFSSSIQGDPNAGTVTFVPNLQQAADTGGSIPFITQTSTPDTFITDSGFPMSDGTVTFQTVPETVWITSNPAPTHQRSSSLTNTVDWAMLDELMQQQSRQQRVTDSVTPNRASQPATTATDGFSLNQVDLSQFTANLDALGGTGLAGLDTQQTAFLPVGTLQSSQSAAAASLAAQETARAAAAQQRVAILASRRNQAAINAIADSQAARNAVALADSQAARNAVAFGDSQAARNAVAFADSQAARNAVAFGDSQAARNAVALADSQAARNAVAFGDSQAARNAVAFGDSQAARNAVAFGDSQAARNAVAFADSQAARNAVASQAARSAAASQAAISAAAASQAARTAVAAQAARADAASQARPVGLTQGGTAEEVLRRAVAAEQSSAAATLPVVQPTRRRGPIFAIVPLTSRANIDDMRKFVRELSASINMAGSEPTIGDNALRNSIVPVGIQQETSALERPNASIAGDSLPPVRPVQVINTVSAESNIPGEGLRTIMSDQPFAVPIPIQDPIAIRTEPVAV